MINSTNVTPPRRWLGIAELEHRIGRSRCTIWRWTRAGAFPKPAYFGSRRAWLESDILGWEGRQIAANTGAAVRTTGVAE